MVMYDKTKQMLQNYNIRRNDKYDSLLSFLSN